MEWIDEASPRRRARITGVVYLLFFLTAILGALVAPGVSGLGGVSGDAGTTANYIVTHESSVRLAEMVRRTRLALLKPTPCDLSLARRAPSTW